MVFPLLNKVLLLWPLVNFLAGQAYGSSEAFKFSSRTANGIYTSPVVNQMYPTFYMAAQTKTGTDGTTVGSSDTKINTYMGTYKSGAQYDLPLNFDFVCPGHSFLTGIYSNDFAPKKTYPMNKAGVEDRLLPFDRAYYFSCAFLDTPAGIPIQKSTCRTVDNFDFMGDGSKTSSCGDNEYLAGVSSTFDTTKKARAAKSVCCKMMGSAKETYVQGTCSPTDHYVISPAGSALSFTCPQNTILKSIATDNLDTDFRFHFVCCNAKTQ